MKLMLMGVVVLSILSLVNNEVFSLAVMAIAATAGLIAFIKAIDKKGENL